ncbi:histone deacetylase HDT1-like isoform X3 [Gossypium arboreum]|uniref:histone deacetylase HDT1-like isoform X3 n=1 Tax=Gossypium arboreum TaxID=29729 RepID=UPI0008190765|nr:histone deacetylase HDT1-like isoform X3 [Gossypium arboreum]
MEFWGAEVKSGQSFEVELEDDGSRILHISQAALGEVTSDNKKEKGNGTACIYLKFNNEKFVIGTLSHDKFPQMPLDLALHSKFELSHTWKNGSVYFTGYYVDTPQGSESEEELLEPIVNPVKPHSTASDPTTSEQIKIVEPKKAEDSSDDEDEDDTSTEDEMSSEDQEPGMLVNGENESNNDTDSDEDDSEEESSDEDPETPEMEKAGPSKKRSAESATKTPAPEKKAKLVTPQKTDGKKVGGHTATPHPSKQARKALITTGQVNQSPKPGGSSFLCKSCGRSFGSENALQSHSKAKHGTAV